MGTAAKPTRGNRTITVDFRDEATYFYLLGDGKALLKCVFAFLLSLGFQLKSSSREVRGGMPYQWNTEIGRAISHTLSRIKSGGGAAYLLSVAGRIACKDVSLFDAFSCPWTPPSTFYKLL